MTDIILIIGVLGAIGLATAVAAWTFGARIARRSRVMAALVCGIILPVLIVAGSYTSFYLGSDNGGDGPVMALAGSFIYAAMSLPVTLIISFLIVWKRSRSADADIQL